MYQTKSLLIRLSLLSILYLAVSSIAPLQANYVGNVVVVKPSESKKNLVFPDRLKKQDHQQLSKKEKRKLRKWTKRFLKNKKNRKRGLIALLGGGFIGFLLKRKMKRMKKKARRASDGGASAGGCILVILLLAGCVALMSLLGLPTTLGIALWGMILLAYFIIRA